MLKRFTPENVTSAYLYLMFTVFALAVGSMGYQNIFEVKTTVFCVLSVGYAVCICLAVALRLHSGEKADFGRIGKAHYFVILYVLVTAVSALISSDFPRTVLGAARFEGAFTVCLYGMIFFFVSAWGRLSDGLIAALACSVILFAAVCILQLCGLNPLWLYPNGLDFYDGGRLYSGSYIGNMGNAGFSGAFLCTVIPALAFGIRKRGRVTAITSVAALIMSVGVLAFIGISAAIVGLVGAAVIAIPAVLRFDRKRVLIYIALCAATAVTACVLLAVFDIGDGMLHEIHLILNGRISDKFGTGRIGIWKQVIGAVGESPILGRGPDTMILDDLVPFTTYYPELGRNLTVKIDNAHNEYLNILYHQGAAGLFAYVGFIVCGFAAFVRRNADRTVLMAGICAAAYLTQAFFGIGICMISSYFWIFAALVCKTEHKNETVTFEA